MFRKTVRRRTPLEHESGGHLVVEILRKLEVEASRGNASQSS